MDTPYILILYYSRSGACAELSHLIARGVEQVDGCHAVIRRIPEASFNNEQTEAELAESGPPYVTKKDLSSCSGLIIGSPGHFGNMSGALKVFWDTTTDLWFSGALVGKPAACFTSTSSMHGGQESTLLSMMNPLFHHGALVMGLPFTEPTLSTTTSGGTPYGVSHVSGPDNSKPISSDEKTHCLLLGSRVAEAALKLQKSS